MVVTLVPQLSAGAQDAYMLARAPHKRATQALLRVRGRAAQTFHERHGELVLLMTHLPFGA